MALACGTLLTLALEVEERVVDADGEPDQQDHFGYRLIHRRDLADERDEPDRREHRRQREQKRQERRDERAEDEQQDDQRQRQGARAGLAELLAEHLFDCLAGADASGLADVERRMPLRDLVGRCGDRVDLRLGVVGGALHLPEDDSRMAVLRDLIGMAGLIGSAEVLDRAVGRDRAGDVVDRGAERRAVHRLRLALNEHDLGLRIGLSEAGLLQDVVGVMRLPDVCVLKLDRVHPVLAARHEGDDDEREPTEDRGLPVARTPAAHPGCQVVRVLQGGHVAPFGRSARVALPPSHQAPSRQMRRAREFGCGYPYCRRYVVTARTRRWSCSSAGRSSFEKMLVTCFSTARSVTTSRSAIAWFDRPSAMSSSTSRSRGVSCEIGSSPRRRPTRRDTTSGSSAEPPSATRLIAAANSFTSETLSFSRYPTPSAFPCRSSSA